MDRNRFLSGLANVAVVVVTVGLGLAAGEMLFRLNDGYRLGTLALALKPTPSLEDATSTLPYARQIVIDPAFKIDWYGASPQRETTREPPMAMPDDWTRAIESYPPGFLRDELKFLYNEDFLEWACKTGNRTNVLRKYKEKPGFVYAYRQPSGSRNPEYRQVPGSGEGANTFNNFGFRGPDLPFKKPPRTIRLAFLGASTTQNGWPFTYPEFVAEFLRQWAKATDLDVTFDVVNAGRGGETSESIAQIMRNEVAPLRPDIVVYYEGANDLHAHWVVDQPTAEARKAGDGRQFTEMKPLPLERYSALANRVYALLFRRGGPGAEPPKPAHTLKFDIDQKDPDIERADLPFRLPTQIQSIREIAAQSKRIGAELFLSTFVVIAKDGLRLDPEKHRIIWHGLNEEYAPLTYAEIQQMIGFENTVFRKLAAKDHLRLIEVYDYFPQEPDFFADTVHFAQEGGFRLQAWIVAQQLTAYIREQLKDGKLPKPSDADPSEIAWLRQPPIKFDLGCVP